MTAQTLKTLLQKKQTARIQIARMKQKRMLQKKMQEDTGEKSASKL